MKVLVIMAAYNGEKYIKEQIDTILSQNNLSINLFIFDDCSLDNTLNILANYKDVNIKIIKNSICSGTAAINFCNAISSIKDFDLNEISYIALSDQDDIWHKDKINIAIERMNENDASLYASNLIMFSGDSSDKKIGGIIKKDFKQQKFDFLFEGGSAGCTYVMEKSFFLKIRDILQNTNYHNWKYFSHDWFIYFVARINNFKVFFDPDSFIYYRIHDTNAHGQLNSFTMYAIIERLKFIANGWYIIQSKGFINLLPSLSEEAKIYKLYNKNYATRIYMLLRYNFKLIRSPIKAIQFFIISILPIQTKIK
jgi:rhamnosyltransferase